MFTRQFVRLLAARLSRNLPFINVVLGPRQVGKSTGVAELIRSYQGEVVSVSADTTPPPTPQWLESNWLRARSLGECLLVVDEVQKIPDWSSVVKRLYDQDRPTGKLKVVLLGSASLGLQRGLTESLAGRYEIVRVPHWDMRECRELFGWDSEKYLRFGGYPAAGLLADDIDRWQLFMRDSIVEPVLGRDIRDYARVEKPALFRQCFELVTRYPAQVVSFNKLLGQLQEGGNASTMRYYLELFAGAFLIKMLPAYTASPIVEKRSSPKIIPLCPALCHTFTSPRRLEDDLAWRGRVLEAAIGAKLSEAELPLSYWSKGKFEVDYILSLDDTLVAIEVKSSYARSARGVELFIREYPAARTLTIDASNFEELLTATDARAWLRGRIR